MSGREQGRVSVPDAAMAGLLLLVDASAVAAVVPRVSRLSTSWHRCC